MNTSPKPPEDRNSEERITKILNEVAKSPYTAHAQDAKPAIRPHNIAVSIFCLSPRSRL